ncbi:hypothetical protein [Ferrimonas marina]|uniref:Uncharacterized protein n=1 Tax=Ferrimonas marina TaxID=299255 RepID=A0A1M5TSX5_9GAMM|nr:hypothetical protein [Ferrimonas marina]SHH53877.1 hypothetical protein SAMN02745129_2267 [Ferrimonas marina]
MGVVVLSVLAFAVVLLSVSAIAFYVHKRWYCGLPVKMGLSVRKEARRFFSGKRVRVGAWGRFRVNVENGRWTGIQDLRDWAAVPEDVAEEQVYCDVEVAEMTSLQGPRRRSVCFILDATGPGDPSEYARADLGLREFAQSCLARDARCEEFLRMVAVMGGVPSDKFLGDVAASANEVADHLEVQFKGDGVCRNQQAEPAACALT